MLRPIKSRDVLLTLLSSALLVCAFPTINLSFLIWFALIPLFFVLDQKTTPGKAFQAGYCCGFFFFAGTLYWFIHVTWVGAFLFVMYLSLYFGVFALGYHLFKNAKPAQALIALSCLWVVLEWIRANLLSGFGWVCLGHSQFKVLPLIQIAEFTGVYGVSFLVILVNLVVKGMFGAQRKGYVRCAIVVALLFIVVLSFGCVRLKEQPSASTMKVAIVQANIDQDRKWDERLWPQIILEYKALTIKAATSKPDLIIWPETAFPGYPWIDPTSYRQFKGFISQVDIPLMAGIVMKEGKDEDEQYFNSAILYSDEGKEVKQYNKIHLVPYGEYVPLRKIMPFIADLLGIDDFTSGEEFTTFHLPGRTSELFSVLICFEDTVADLTRRFVLNGAKLLVNVTNDAWFGDTKAPYLHWQASVFRTIENRRGLIRSTNTGVSCFIDPYGRIEKCVEDADGQRSYVTGVAVHDIAFNDQLTFYTKYGNIFAYLCFACILWGIVRRRNNNC